MIKSFKPLNDRVLIKPIEQGEKKSGAILIASIGDENTTRIGKVIAVGPGRKTEFGTFIEPVVKPEDYVVIPKIGAQRVTIEDEEYWVIADKELVAVVDYSQD